MALELWELRSEDRTWQHAATDVDDGRADDDDDAADDDGGDDDYAYMMILMLTTAKTLVPLARHGSFRKRGP